jgi:GST-like protein
VTDTPEYTPPKVWTWNKENGGRFANINRPIAGATHDKELPVGKHPFQLYSLATPNDRSGPTPIRIFESGAILVHLAEKFGAFLPTEAGPRAECLSWLFWQMGSAPFLGGGFGHFYAYAPFKIEYAIDRYAMEVKRQLDVLDRRLGEAEYLGGDAYSIADMATWPWYGALVKGLVYDAGEFLQVQDYKNVQRWTDAIAARPAVQRGRMVNRAMGDLASQLRERHDASDFLTRTQDKLEAAD